MGREFTSILLLGDEELIISGCDHTFIDFGCYKNFEIERVETSGGFEFCVTCYDDVVKDYVVGQFLCKGLHISKC